MSYCFADLGEHEQNLCGVLLSGGNNAIGILEKSHGIINFSDKDEWAAAILANKAKIVLGIKGNFPAGAPKTQPNPQGCGAEQILTGFDYTFPFIDANVNDTNDEFYSKLNSRTLNLVWFECENNQIRVVNKNVTFAAVPATLPESNTEYQVYSVTASWTASREWYPARYTAPDEIFDVDEE